MFTGIVEEIGKIVSVKKGAQSLLLTIGGHKIFDDLKIGDSVAGHIVAGHVDGTGRIVNMKRTDNAIVFTISAPKSIMDYVIYKGSITIDGISLTIMERTESTFSVSIIPHTLSETVLGHASIGTEVNLETDITGRYIRHFMTLDEPTHISKSQKSMESLLVENGFM